MSSPIRILLSALLVGLALPVSAQDIFAEVRDDRGEVVQIAQQPQRVASLGVFGADMMLALGKSAVGTTTYNGQLPAYLGARPDTMADLGIEPQPNLERLTELQPDLIIGIRRYTEPWADSFAPIAPYIAYDMLTEADSTRAVSSVAVALGAVGTGEKLNAEFEQMKAQMAEQAPGGVSAVFVWLWQDTLYAYYDHVMPASFFSPLKVRNTMGSNPTPELPENFGGPVSYEDILAQDPDVLIVFRAEGNAYPDHPALRRLRAVREGRAWHVGYQYSQPAGPVARKIILQEMAHLLYPDVFADPALPDQVRAEPLRFEN
ncbi:ABC transporter substrate-binding protein [Paracoccus caeni]|uniref:ABC transporter substrate-binding protein n=1 Tax=Paracoccus caeni TaxID=657651 RepID=A0A934W2K5_9RHOB|nr:ABC transporter substrate-binding protein [Paracoccus caeni]MBK4217874.1 ABC transporter substrate-binding protein [Paracoccus caeni]